VQVGSLAVVGKVARREGERERERQEVDGPAAPCSYS